MKRNVLEYLEATARSHPDKRALVDDNEALTYREYLRKAQSIGTALAREVGSSNRPIAVAIGRDVRSIVLFMAIVYSGNCYVPLDLSQPVERVRRMLETIEPVAVVANGDGAGFAAHAGKDVPFFDSSALWSLDDVDESVLGDVREKAIDTDPLYVLFTSGSTGIPKGVVVTHRSVIDLVEQFCSVFGFDESSAFGNQAPFDFDVSVKDIYNAMKCAGTVHVIPKRLFSFPAQLIEHLNEQNINTLIWATSALRIVENFKTFESVSPRGLRSVMFSGEIMPCKVLNYWRRHLPDTDFVNLYGPTEITCNCTYFKVKRDFADTDALPIGVPFENTRVVLLDEDDTSIQKPGAIGEICVMGSSLAVGYYNNPEQTSRAFCQNPLNRSYREPLYRTGDLAEYNERGELVFRSRKDSQIKHMGHRIELAEIECAANALADVKAAFCHYAEEEELIHLYYQADEERDRLVVRALRDFLPKYMIPQRVHYCETFPLNKNGKIDRKRIVDENG